MIHKLLKRPQAIIGLCLIAIVIVIAIAAPAFSPHDPELVNLSQKYAQPDAEYPLGTDQLGRCTLSRLLYGARYSIGISLPVLLILSVIGLIVGTFSACAGEKADHFITIVDHCPPHSSERLSRSCWRCAYGRGGGHHLYPCQQTRRCDTRHLHTEVRPWQSAPPHPLRCRDA